MSLALRMSTVLILNQAAFAGAGAMRSHSSQGYGRKFIFMRVFTISVTGITSIMRLIHVISGVGSMLL